MIGVASIYLCDCSHKSESCPETNFILKGMFDSKGVFGVENNNKFSFSRGLEGASTITQQVNKNFLLSNQIRFVEKFNIVLVDD